MTLIPYDRQAAVLYASTWAYYRNPIYYDFSELGGDCANFASQVLVAGGMPMNFTPTFGWYYRSIYDRSPSFTSTQYLFEFLTNGEYRIGPVAEIVDIHEVALGDIIQLSFDGESFTHTLIVIQKNGDDPYVASHTYDTYGVPLSSYTFKKARALHILGAIP